MPATGTPYGNSPATPELPRHEGAGGARKTRPLRIRAAVPLTRQRFDPSACVATLGCEATQWLKLKSHKQRI